MGMSKLWQMVHFGAKYSFKPWYVNKAFSEISHPYQHTTESTEQIRTTQLKGHCLNASQLRIKYTTSSVATWHLLSSWGYTVIPNYTKTQTIPHYGMQWLFQEVHKITVTRKIRIIGEETTHTDKHTGLVEKCWKFQNETGLEHTDANQRVFSYQLCFIGAAWILTMNPYGCAF